MSSPLLTALREGTADAHRALEAEIDFSTAALTMNSYLQTLRIFHAFVSSWEKLAARHCPPHLQAFLRNRWRAPLLEDDLDFFTVSRIEAKPLLPFVDTPSSFLGVLYVMEGSTLGGQVIARQLESVLGLSRGKGYSYFRGHGSDTGKMWKEFMSLLAQEAPSLEEAAVVAAASRMFTAFRAFHADQMRQVSVEHR